MMEGFRKKKKTVQGVDRRHRRLVPVRYSATQIAKDRGAWTRDTTNRAVVQKKIPQKIDFMNGGLPAISAYTNLQLF